MTGCPSNTGSSLQSASAIPAPGIPLKTTSCSLQREPPRIIQTCGQELQHWGFGKPNWDTRIPEWIGISLERSRRRIHGSIKGQLTNIGTTFPPTDANHPRGALRDFVKQSFTSPKQGYGSKLTNHETTGFRSFRLPGCHFGVTNPFRPTPKPACRRRLPRASARPQIPG